MKSPVKDIIAGLALGITVGLVWRKWKGGEMDRISRYYEWQEAEMAKSKTKKKTKKKKKQSNDNDSNY
ncbi:hypothetical protein KXD40_001398 [Peronospora effusa]|uniref:Uncharacterized protein n=1 Tax=Peronospora effusa TaxID=542832 RepID=A0A3M6VUR4_9STRA|nr:hypothetical protein DD238_000247 [Peronospora effusa]RQM09023.1 hypothetical protein DD237_000495 [Peronospora effusa]UIZ21053.1 hypothetical protein KXD40_001398 [Peronospora effusa]